MPPLTKQIQHKLNVQFRAQVEAPSGSSKRKDGFEEKRGSDMAFLEVYHEKQSHRLESSCGSNVYSAHDPTIDNKQTSAPAIDTSSVSKQYDPATNFKEACGSSTHDPASEETRACGSFISNLRDDPASQRDSGRATDTPDTSAYAEIGPLENLLLFPDIIFDNQTSSSFNESEMKKNENNENYDESQHYTATTITEQLNDKELYAIFDDPDSIVQLSSSSTHLIPSVWSLHFQRRNVQLLKKTSLQFAVQKQALRLEEFSRQMSTIRNI